MFDMTDQTITDDLLISAYCQGVFPMADSRGGQIQWYSPDPRAILPLTAFHIPKSLQRQVNKAPYLITADADFPQVITACARPRKDHPETWINQKIIDLYTNLHYRNLAHSFEAWRLPEDGNFDERELVGGLYGVSIGAAFFGESMFSTAKDASKICLVHLVNHLNNRGYQLLDVQFSNPHLEQFGIVEIPRMQYLSQLDQAIGQNVFW